VVIACMGLSPLVEGEEGCTLEADLAGDKRDIALYKAQLEVLKAALESTTPVVLVLLNGSAITLGGLEKEVSAIIEAWYPGEMGGAAIADVLFGRYNPAGRLPITFYASMDQVPDFGDYRMDGRTYRYFGGEPLYAFGYGLSYTKFTYSRLTVCKQAATGDTVRLSVDVKNAGPMAGDEVVQVYIRPVNPSTRAPLYQLCGFDRVHLKAGARTIVALDLPASAFSVVTDDGRRMVEPGEYDLFVGGSLPSVKGAKTLTARVQMEGPRIELPGAFKRAD
jgi:beta-glucosidase